MNNQISDTTCAQNIVTLALKLSKSNQLLIINTINTLIYAQEFDKNENLNESKENNEQKAG